MSVKQRETLSFLVALALGSLFTLPGVVAAEEPITLRWLADISGGPERVEFYEAVADAFNSQHDDIKVELETVPNFALYYERLTLQMAADLAPDLVFSNSPANIAEGFYLDLTPFIENDPEFQLSEFLAAAVDLGRVAGRPGLYALPNHLSTHGLYYNADMFREAGLSTPNELVAQEDWSWDTFRNMGQKIIMRDADGRLQRGLISALNFGCFIAPSVPE